jgi:hypothetical protein
MKSTAAQPRQTKRVSAADLTAAVARMEARLAAHPSPAVAALLRHYRRLCERFEADLGASRRDVLLAQASALMLVQAVAHAADGRP